MIVLLTAAIAVFGVGLVLFERHMRKPEGPSDTGEWGWHESGEEIRLKIGDKRLTYTDAVDAYLVIGTDATGSKPGAQQGYNGSMADFLMLLMVNRTSGRFDSCASPIGTGRTKSSGTEIRSPRSRGCSEDSL